MPLPTKFTHPTAKTTISCVEFPHYGAVYRDHSKWTTVEFTNGSPIPGTVHQHKNKGDAVAHLMGRGYVAD